MLSFEVFLFVDLFCEYVGRLFLGARYVLSSKIMFRDWRSVFLRSKVQISMLLVVFLVVMSKFSFLDAFSNSIVEFVVFCSVVMFPF